MGEGLVIQTTIDNASDILKVIKDPAQLSWEEGPDRLDALARWLPKKGFKILPKIFERDGYRPGTVGDEGDRLIVKVEGCTLRHEEGGEPIPVWHDQILQLPEMREELRRIVEGNVLDMSFEEEVVRVMEEKFGEGKASHKVDERSLQESNFTLKRLGEILLRLIDCMDQVKRTRGISPFFDFYIHE